MTRSAQRVTATVICVLAGVSLLMTVMWLAVDPAHGHLSASRLLVDRLEQNVKSDPSLQATLVSERDLQIELSLRSWSHKKMGTVVIAVSAVLFLVSAKLLLAARPPPAVTLADIRACAPCRHAPTPLGAPAIARRSEANAADNEADWSFLDTVIAREGCGPETVIPILQAIQKHYRYLPDEALKRVCALTQIEPAQIAGVSTFYAQFRRTPVGRHVVKVCHGTACHVSGASQITQEIRRHLGIAVNADTDPQRMFTVDKVACVGCCSLAPVIMIDDETVGRLTSTDACEAIEAVRALEQLA